MEEVIEEKKDISKQKKKSSLFLKILKEVLAITFWLYLVLKVFIFDIDIYLIGYFFPEYISIIKYKFFILIGAVSLIWMFTRNKKIITWGLYIIFYPFILIAKFLFFLFLTKGWNLGMALLDAIITFFKSIKYNFIVSSIFILAVLLIVKSSNIVVLWVSLSSIFLILTITFIHRFLIIFKPSNIFKIFSKAVSSVRTYVEKQYALDEKIKVLPVSDLSDLQLQGWVTNLQSVVLVNKLFYFFALKLKDYQNSKYNIVSYVLNLFLLILVTALSFASISLALFKIDPSLFAVYPGVGLFNFFFYSFNNLFFNNIDEIKAIKQLSQTAFMFEQFSSFFLGVILFTLVLNISSERHSEEINKAIEDIKDHGRMTENFIQDEYKMDIVQAVTELERLKSGAINWIYKLSKSIE